MPVLERVGRLLAVRRRQFSQCPQRSDAHARGAKAVSACHDDKPALLQNSEPTANRVAMHMTCLRRVPVAEKYRAVVVTVVPAFQLDVERPWTRRQGCPRLRPLHPFMKLHKGWRAPLVLFVWLAAHSRLSCGLTAIQSRMATI